MAQEDKGFIPHNNPTPILREIRKWMRPLTPEEVTKIYNGEDIDE